MPNRNKLKTRTSLHSIHPYPCKFPEDVVRENLVEGTIVLDPYCGSGTTLLEAALCGYEVCGLDCNPIALLITRAKLVREDSANSSQIRALLDEIGSAIPQAHKLETDLPDFAGRDHWFSDNARREFGFLRTKLDSLEHEGDEWIGFATIASSLVTRFSNQDSETRYARVDREPEPGVILKTFLAKFSDYQTLLSGRGDLAKPYSAHLCDFGNQSVIDDGTIDQIITSPPYANTMDYYLYHKQRMNFLGYDFKLAQKLEIGSRHEYSSQKQDRTKWDQDLKNGLRQAFRVLKNGGQAIYVIGDSQIAKVKVDASEMVLRLAAEVGFRGEVIRSEPMTGKSRLFSQAFQAPNKFEHTLRLLK